MKDGGKHHQFFPYLKDWINQGYIIEQRQPPKLGGIKFRYSLSEKAIKKLQSIKNKWNKVH